MSTFDKYKIGHIEDREIWGATFHNTSPPTMCFISFEENREWRIINCIPLDLPEDAEGFSLGEF